MTGGDKRGAMGRSRNHQGWIKGGGAHFLGPVKVTLVGDEAIAVCHSLMVVNNGGSFEEAPNFVVRRATAHHFELVRADGVWLVAKRTSRVLDGRAESPELLVKRSEEHTSELQSLMRISYAVFCLKKKRNNHKRA